MTIFADFPIILLFYFPMTETCSHSFQKYAKILTILRKRKRSEHPNLAKGSWPTQTSFTILNSIDALTQPPDITPSSKPTRNHSARTLKSTTLNTTSPILRLERPSTSTAVSSQKGRRTAEPNHRKCPERSLF